MHITNQVCSLTQAQELLELGVRCESLWSWKIDSQQVILSRKKLSSTQIVSDNIIPAYTCAELGVMLPWIIDISGIPHTFELAKNLSNVFLCGYCWDNYELEENLFAVEFESETEAQARASALTWLIKSGHTKAEEVKL